MENKNFLEADISILEKNLKIIKNNLEEINIFENDVTESSVKVPPRDYNVVQPKPGLCLKSLKINTNEKYFINVCQTKHIPPPEDISDEQLSAILNSETPSAYRIPMSISEPRLTKDKAGNPVEVCDIAINPKFFQKIEKSLAFKNFFVALVAEAMSDKYNVQLNVDKSIILSNRKFIGTLVSHRIRNHDVKTVLTSYQTLSPEEQEQLNAVSNPSGSGTSKKGPLVQEIDKAEADKLKKEAKIMELVKSEPVYKLRVRIKGDQTKELQAEFYLPKCSTVNDFTLDIGEDRILLESSKHEYHFDKFINFTMDQEFARAIFDKTSKMLQVRIPIIAG